MSKNICHCVIWRVLSNVAGRTAKLALCAVMGDYVNWKIQVVGNKLPYFSDRDTQQGVSRQENPVSFVELHFHSVRSPLQGHLKEILNLVGI